MRNLGDDRLSDYLNLFDLGDNNQDDDDNSHNLPLRCENFPPLFLQTLNCDICGRFVLFFIM